MKVRHPRFDLFEALPHWASDHAFAHAWNSASYLLPSLEPFLNRVAMRVRGELSKSNPEDAALRHEIDVFVQQEGTHYRVHELYNNVLEQHYPDLPIYKAEMDAFFGDLLKSESMKYLTAFCEGFEAVGPVMARMWLDGGLDDYLKDANPAVTNMWKWHWSEEYEHRTTCFNAHKRYSRSYFYRTRVTLSTLAKLERFTTAMQDYMIETDISRLAPAEQPAARMRMAEGNRKFTRTRKQLTTLPILSIFNPFYDPARAKAPRNYASYINWVEENIPMNQRMSAA